MTEQEWMACTDSRKMFRHFGGVFGKMRLDPRLRRFAVESCRRVRHLLTDNVFLQAANAGEAFADDPRNEKPTIPAMARAAIEGVRRLRNYPRLSTRHQFHAASAAVATCGSTDWQAAYNAMRETAQALNKGDPDSCLPFELKYQADLLRCIFGPLLFRPITINPTWLTPTVVQLAETIYEERAFDRLPILADALSEAGCNNQDILNHCRQTGQHVRGCWCLDLLLGNE